MGLQEQIQQGMPVYRADGRLLGEVKELWGESLYAGDETIPTDAIDHIADSGVYLKADLALRPVDPQPDRRVTASQGTAGASNNDDQVDAANIMSAATIPGVGAATTAEPQRDPGSR